MSLNPLTLIEKVITEHGSAAVQKTHLDLLKTQIVSLQSERDQLAEESTQLKMKLKEAEANLAELAKSENFVTKSGILWKPDGERFEPIPYCPRCKVPMTSAINKFICCCCDFVTNKSRPPAKS